MYSSDDDVGPTSAPAKRRKTQRACDLCRQKKLRCDGGDVGDNKCSNCISNGIDCVYSTRAMKPRASKGYVESLENRLQKMEKLLKQLAPDIDLSASALEASTLYEPGDARGTAAKPNTGLGSIGGINSVIVSTPDSLDDASSSQGDDEDELATLTLAEVMKRMTLSSEYRFFGKSCDIMLVQTALDIKNQGARTPNSSILHVGPSINSEPASTYDIASIPFTMNGLNPNYGVGESSLHPGFRGGHGLYEDASNRKSPSLRRPEFWTNRPWERLLVPPANEPSGAARGAFINSHNEDASSAGPPASHITPSFQPTPTVKYVFPPPDLLSSLVELYFEHCSAFFPLLHKPTFLRHLKDGKHLGAGEEADTFAANVLLVCAIGSRWSEDPRVRIDHVDAEAEAKTAGRRSGDGQNEDGHIPVSWHSSGWKYFNQVQLIRKSLFQPPSLLDLQFYCLAILFLQGSSAPQACWILIGIGIRLAQDVGAHRRKIRKPPPSPTTPPAERAYLAKERMEEEEWSRAWWGLVLIDRILCSVMGRPCATQDEDFDLDLPTEVDDEYWEDPTGENDIRRMFKQPQGKPSIVSFFVQLIKLNKLWAFSLRTIYSIKKSKIRLGPSGHQRERQIVTEIDSALNKWVDRIPDHLRWNPQHPDRVFFNQSVFLYASYYHLQILIHRPFIPSPRKPSPLSLPSLAICTNAARSCSHIIDVHRRRILEEEARKKERGELPHGLDGRTKAMLPHYVVSVFTSGIVLILSIWGSKRSTGRTGVSTGPSSSSARGVNLGREIGDLHKCMMVLKLCEERWQLAGRLWDILAELASIGDLPLPDATAGAQTSDDISPPPRTLRPSMPPGMDLSIPHPQHAYTQLDQQATAGLEQPFSFSLPVYPAELQSFPGFAQGDIRSMQQRQAHSWYGPSQSTIPSYEYDFTNPSLFASVASTSNQASAYYANSYVDPSQPSGTDPRRDTVSAPNGDALDHMPLSDADWAEALDGLDVPLVDNDIMTMWSNAPAGLELEEWRAYLELAQGMQGQLHDHMLSR